MTDPAAALDAIGRLPDAEIDIAGAAIQFARIDTPDADWQAAEAHLSELARRAVAAAATETDATMANRARALKRIICDEFGYAGDTETYDDLANANLIRVIERRKGLPVALGIIWLHMARAAGWPAHGVDFPGHFLVALEDRTSRLMLDVFNAGHVLEARELRAMIKRAHGTRIELHPDMIASMSTREVLLRLQNNILTRRGAAEDLTGALTCCEAMLKIAPDRADLWRSAGLLNRRLEHVGAALSCFERSLELVQERDMAARLRATIDELRMRLN
jgi:regulator of sirC expression with transglutaminase-like and TPR domain